VPEQKPPPHTLAIRQDDADGIERLVRANPQLLQEEMGVGTMLHFAAQCGSLNVVKRLVTLGMDVNATKHPGYPEPPEGPIWNAVLQGHVEVVKWLLEHGANSNCVLQSTGEVRNFALVQAVEDNRVDLVQLLVQYGADVNVHFADQAPLTIAEDSGHTEIANYLRSKGALTLEEIKARAKGKRKKS
jgi:ankyrin repeat protein